MEELIIKYTKEAAAQLYNRDVDVEFHKLTDLGVCLYSQNLIWFNERLLTGKKTADEIEYWWKLMIHEVTHFEIHNENSKTHNSKFYAAMRRNLKAVENIKKEMLAEVLS